MKHVPQLGLIFALVFLVGCASLERNSYRTVAAISETVFIAMRAYGDSVRAGHVSEEKQAQVKRLYENYQKVMAATEEVVNGYYELKKLGREDPNTLKVALAQVSDIAEVLIDVAQEYTGKN